MIQSFSAVIVHKKAITSEMLWLQFKLIEPKEIDFIPGQYVIVDIPIPQENGGKATRLYSLCSPDYQKKYIGLLIHTIPQGLASVYFNHLQERDVITFRGPAGKFILQSEHKNKIFLATGTGIAPIRSQIYSFFHRHAYTSLRGGAPNIQLLWGVKTRQEAFFAHEFQRLKKLYAYFSFSICLSREKNLKNVDLSCFRGGRITETFHKEGVSHDTEYYICGSPEVVASVIQFLKNHGIAQEQIFFEKF